MISSKRIGIREIDLHKHVYRKLQEWAVSHTSGINVIIGPILMGSWDTLHQLTEWPILVAMWRTRGLLLAWRKRSPAENLSEDVSRIKYIVVWASLCALLSFISIALIVWVVAIDWHPLNLDNIFGLLVALTASRAAAAYYVKIFSGVITKQYSAHTEFWLRANAVWFFPPVLCTIVLNPSWWIFFIPIGGIQVIANNFMSYNFCKKTVSLTEEVYNKSPTPAQKDFLQEFSGWWYTYLFYEAFLVFLGILDIIWGVPWLWLWAIMASIINTKMYFQNCGNAAPRIRYHLVNYVEQFNEATEEKNSAALGADNRESVMTELSEASYASDILPTR